MVKGGEKAMYRVQSDYIRHLSKKEYAMLAEMCRYSNNLYNVAVYNIRQQFFRGEGYLPYEKNYKLCKTNENYGLLQAGVAQQTLKMADRSFQSFFALLKLKKEGSYDKEVRIPHYREKGGMFGLTLSTNAISIKDGWLKVPMSRAFSKSHGGRAIRIRVPERLEGCRIKEVRIVPSCRGQYFRIQYVCEDEGFDLYMSQNRILAIDVGLDNLAACITTLGTSFLVDGRKLKSINRRWNKEMAKLQGITDRQKLKGRTKRMDAITKNRNNQARDYLFKAARIIVDYCISNDIGTIVCGCNKEQKDGISLGKKTNQSFVQISFGLLRSQLASLCEHYGIRYIEQEESYTSKASFLDLDEIPVFEASEETTAVFSGKRIHRGLYRFGNGRKANADLNGAANILRKSKQKFDFEQLSRGLLACPSRIRVA